MRSSLNGLNRKGDRVKDEFGSKPDDKDARLDIRIKIELDVDEWQNARLW